MEKLLDIILTPEGRILLLLLRGPATAEELAEKIGRSLSRTYTYLKLLSSYGLVKRESGGLYHATDRAHALIKTLCDTMDH